MFYVQELVPLLARLAVISHCVAVGITARCFLGLVAPNARQTDFIFETQILKAPSAINLDTSGYTKVITQVVALDNNEWSRMLHKLLKSHTAHAHHMLVHSMAYDALLYHAQC